MADDGTISNFLAITGTVDVSTATSYLEMSGGNLDMAVGLYMEHNPATTTNNNTVGGSSMPGEIRAPDAVQTDRLVDVPGPGHPAAMMMNAMMSGGVGGATGNVFMDARAMANAMNSDVGAQPQNRNLWSNSNSGFYDDSDEEFEDHDRDTEILERLDGGEEEKEMDSQQNDMPASATLSDLFSAPTHLIHSQGGFQGARTAGKLQKKWLLVNIQNDVDFACHALNRDVWRDELVINMVQEGFIFWQAYDNSTDGMTYCQRYGVHGFPHIAILDPRTGRLMWKKEGWTQINPLQAGDFAQGISDFCSRHSIDEPPRAMPPHMGSKSNNNIDTNGSLTNKRSIDSMSEDEQLKAALAASMVDVNDDKSNLKTTNDVDSEGMSQEDDSDEKKFSSTLLRLQSISIGDEPKKGPRIQFRMPDGKRIVRRFNASDKVEIIYAFIAQTVDEAKSGKSFVLKSGFPPKDLVENMQETIEVCGLSGAATNVTWTD